MAFIDTGSGLNVARWYVLRSSEHPSVPTKTSVKEIVSKAMEMIQLE